MDDPPQVGQSGEPETSPVGPGYRRALPDDVGAPPSIGPQSGTGVPPSAPQYVLAAQQATVDHVESRLGHTERHLRDLADRDSSALRSEIQALRLEVTNRIQPLE